MGNQTVMRSVQDLDAYFQSLGVKRLFLVCGNSIRKLRMDGYFRELGERITVVRFSGFTPNPRYEEAAEAARAFRDSGCGAIAAVGGGSAMDVAKCVRLWAGLGDGEDLLAREPAPDPPPLLAVPTTAGTGSEATRYAVVYDRGEKQSITHENCLPSAVLLDPSALESLPDGPRKASMLDALCHGIESFWSVRATAESREYARAAIGGILENLEAYLENDPAGNAGMLEAAHLAGKAINLAQTTAGHAMCYKLTSLYGAAHGHAAALCVSKLWPFLAERCGGTELEGVLRELAAAMGCRTIPESVEKFEGLLARLGLEAPKLRPGDLPVLQRSVNPVRLKNHPIIPSPEEISGLYRQILAEGEPDSCG